MISDPVTFDCAEIFLGYSFIFFWKLRMLTLCGWNVIRFVKDPVRTAQ
jgi:hypothetical protein